MPLLSAGCSDSRGRLCAGRERGRAESPRRVWAHFPIAVIVTLLSLLQVSEIQQHPAQSVGTEVLEQPDERYGGTQDSDLSTHMVRQNISCAQDISYCGWHVQNCCKRLIVLQIWMMQNTQAQQNKSKEKMLHISLCTRPLRGFDH